MRFFAFILALFLAIGSFAVLVASSQEAAAQSRAPVVTCPWTLNAC